MLVIVALQSVTHDARGVKKKLASDEELPGSREGFAEKEIKQNLRSDAGGCVEHHVLPVPGTGGEVGLVPFIEAGYDQSAEYGNH